MRLHTTIFIGFSLVITSMFLLSCEKEGVQKLESRSWNLTWSDEFDGDSAALPDNSKWTYDLGTGQGGWGNQELQSYTNKAENVSTDGKGNLVISALSSGNNFTSARIKTEGLFDQRYGRFEARMKTPYGPGLWPAFWLLGSNISTVGWPQCGEIDIMELKGQEPHIIHGSIHGPGYSAGNSITKSHALVNSRYDVDYHIYAVEWSEDRIDFFMDEFLYHRILKKDVPNWVFDNPCFIILNVAVGGNYVGFPTANTPFPQKLIVDYVRVYSKK